MAVHHLIHVCKPKPCFLVGYDITRLDAHGIDAHGIHIVEHGLPCIPQCQETILYHQLPQAPFSNISFTSTMVYSFTSLPLLPLEQRQGSLQKGWAITATLLGFSQGVQELLA